MFVVPVEFKVQYERAPGPKPLRTYTDEVN